MDINEIRKDFSQRYEKDCEDIFFVGQPVVFFESPGKTISACLSVGECMAYCKRDDDRVTIQFSENDRKVSFNLQELFSNKNEWYAREFISLQEFGINTFGGDFFIYKNSQITKLSRPLLAGTFLNASKTRFNKEMILAKYEDFADNMASLSGRHGCFSAMDGHRISHFRFFSNTKIVLSVVDKNFVIRKRDDSKTIDEALLSVKHGDVEKFGKLLDKGTELLIKENAVGKTALLFDSAKETNDAFGNGILKNGGIFSVVHEEKIDTFIGNLSAKYRKFYGGTPDFYVTEPWDSGVFRC